MHFCMLDEVTTRDHWLHLFHCREMVVHSINLPWAWASGGVAYRESELARLVFHQPVDQRALANA